MSRMNTGRRIATAVLLASMAAGANAVVNDGGSGPIGGGGTGGNNGGTVGVTEPSTLLLMGLGLAMAGAAVVRSRRRRK